ncbi:MAG: ankyrin repeat domain-containing protein, partial [Hyphomicrobiaceae bacterium]
LICFIAENPVRNDRLPANIADVAQLLIDMARAQHVPTLQEDLDYTLGLVASGRVPRESGVQEVLISVLTRAGADPNLVMRTSAAHREVAACHALLAAGAELSLNLAAAIGSTEDVERLASGAGAFAIQEALAIAATNGRAELIDPLINAGANPNQFNPEGTHAHSTPLHQAVDAGSLETVKILIARGADPAIRDKVFSGNAMGWAIHTDKPDIADYLNSLDS